MRELLVGVVFVAVCGCATIVKGTSQVVAINAPGAAGAMCVLTSPAIGTRNIETPGTITLEKSKENISVRCQKECFSDGVGVIQSDLEVVAAGNLLIGGLIGIGIDAASGALNHYTPSIEVAMVPVPGCRRR